MKRRIYFTLYAAVIGFSCLSTPAQQAAPTPPNPLTLAQAVALALENNPALREAQGRISSAQASVSEAESAQGIHVRLDTRYTALSTLPEIRVSTLAPPITLGEKNTLVADLAASKVIFSGGRLAAISALAANSARATETISERTRQVVVYQAERSFLLLLAAQRNCEVARQTLKDAEDHLKDARARLEARTVARYDVLRAEVQVQEAQQGVIQADTSIQTAQAALLQALGLREGQFSAQEDGLPIPVKMPSLDALLQRADTDRPELRALAFQLKAADAAVAAARGEKKPTVSLVADYQVASPESPIQFTRASAGIVAGVPIFDAGYANARIHEAEAQREQLRATRNSQQNAVVTEVKQAYARLTAATAQLLVAQKRVDFATEMFNVANVRYDAGVATATEVADAQTVLASARQGLILARTDRGTAEAALRLAVGGPLNPEISTTEAVR
ncbi:MAG: TolC family protein [Armatimonadota bacterium]